MSKDNPLLDSQGNKIRPGDILQSTYANLEPTYFVCFIPEYDLGSIEIRDLNNNNLGTCNLGTGGDVINIGHFSKHLDKLNNEDLTNYFGLNIERAKEHGCEVVIRQESDLKRL